MRGRVIIEGHPEYKVGLSVTQSFKNWLKNNFAHTQARLVLVQTVIVFIIILAVSLTSYYTSKTVLQEELSEPQRQMLQLNMNVIDESIKESDKVAVQVAVNSRIYEFLTAEVQNSFGNISELYQLLSTLISNSQYVKSLYVYDLNRESFISLPQGYSSNSLTFVDSEWVSVKDEFGDRMTLIKKRQVPEGAGSKGSEITLFRKIMIQGKFMGIVAVNLKSDELFARLTPPVLNNLNRMRYIMNQQDEVLYSASNYQVDQEAIREGIREISADGTYEMPYQGRKLLVNQLESPETGWRFVSIVEQDSLLAKSKKVRDAVLMVSLAAILIGLVTIFCINAAAYRPVRRLKQLFNTYGSNGRKGGNPDGIDLEKLAGELLSNHAHLAQLIRETMSEASSKLLYDIYMGNLTGKRDIREKWGRYFEDWSEAPVTIAILSIDRYEEFERTFPAGDRSLLKFALANIAAELSEPQWRIVCADFGNDRTAILLQSKYPESEAKAENVLAEAIEMTSRLLKFSVSAGISTSQTDVTRLRQGMLEAENALTYRLYQGYGQVILFREVSGHEVMEPLSDEETLGELIRVIQAGETEGSVAAVERLTGAIRARYGYPTAAAALLQEAAERIEELRPSPQDSTRGHGFERFDTLRLEDIGNELANRARHMAEGFHRLIASKDFIQCHRMIDYMKQHLGEPIGIPEIAESIEISSSLASQVFKQETGETIYNYLTRLRMDRAAELLLKTDYKISDIAQQVGYQHENSFIRSFRKYKDITPGKYRDMMRIRTDALLE
jgi:AraC-like DNA-binding protein